MLGAVRAAHPTAFITLLVSGQAYQLFLNDGRGRFTEDNASGLARTFGASLKYIYTRPLIINALRTNGNQAEMLCKSEPHTYFGAVGAAIKVCSTIIAVRIAIVTRVLFNMRSLQMFDVCASSSDTVT